MSASLNQLSAGELIARLQRGEISNAEIVRATLDRIEAVEPSIRAFITVRDRSDLLIEAEAVDQRRRRGESVGPLGGLPVAVKDNINTTSIRTTCASKILENYIPTYDATVIRKIKEADGIILGKTNLDEFAMGSSTENSAFQVTRNPHNLDYVAGGSSGGSAGAVAAHETILAIGSDTGGSVRLPASYCGVVGLKPSYGRVSRYGLVAFGSSLDQIGPLARTVDDAELLFSAIAGHDPCDSTSVPDHVASGYIDPLGPLRIGVPKEYFVEGVAPEVRAACRRVLEVLKQSGHESIPISLPHTEYAVSAYYIIACAEASANLERYDGVRYGLRAADYTSFTDMLRKTRTAGFGSEVRRRIMLGTYVLSSGYYDAYYIRASKVRTLIRRDFDEAFTRCDFLLTPVAPTPAFKIGEKTADPLMMYLNDIFSVTANLTGLPAISIPCGRSEAGLPLSVQLTGPMFSERLLFNVARLVEQHSEADPTSNLRE
ncbi:MAG: Asp-tRNA(Asn)/Glu-tRNA(Gln) amidotransferase subunit GatA [Blastocatellia bacterium]